MADFFGENATLRDSNVPSDKIRSQDQHGRMRIARDKFTFTAILDTTDLLRMMKLPAGAKVYEVELNSDDLGTTGVLDIGWAASSEGGEVADQNGLFAAIDVNSAATARLKILNSVPGFLKRFTEEVEIQIKATTATTATSGDIELIIYYVVD